MSTEIAVFDPNEIQTQGDRNLAKCLRMLADALDAGTMDGKLVNAQGHGFTPANDRRAHILVKIDFAAPVFTRRTVEDEQQLTSGIGGGL